MKPIRHLAFVVNRNKAGAPGLARELAAVARATGVRLKQTSRFPLPTGYLNGMDACCVIGGDGTQRGASRLAQGAEGHSGGGPLGGGPIGGGPVRGPQEKKKCDRTMTSCKNLSGIPN